MAIYPDKKDGKLTGRFRVELQQGRQRYRKRWDSFADAQKDEAAQKAAMARGDTLNGAEPAPGAPDTHTFATVFPLAEGKLWRGQSTEDTTWARMKLIASIVGQNTRLDAVDTHMVDSLIAKLRKLGKSDGTINRYLAHLSKFLKWAKSRNYRKAPLEGLEFDRAEESEGRLRWITQEEEAALGAYLSPRAPHVWSLIQIAIETGCRRDELLTATTQQIAGNILHLWAQGTKSKKYRTVPMRPETTEALRDLIVSGNMPSRRNLRSWWERARKEMGLEKDPDFVFHACRHTCATRMVDAGVNILVIKEWLGHSVIQTTLRYAHVKPENLQDALAKVGNHRPANAENPQISAISGLPPRYPTGGEMGHFSKAA